MKAADKKELNETINKIEKDKNLLTFEKNVRMKEAVFNYYNNNLSDDEILKEKRKLLYKIRVRDYYIIPIIIGLFLAVFTANNFIAFKYLGENFIYQLRFPFITYADSLKESINEATDEFDEYINFQKEHTKDIKRINIYENIKKETINNATINYNVLVVISIILCLIIVLIWISSMVVLGGITKFSIFNQAQKNDLINYQLYVIEEKLKISEMIYCERHNITIYNNKMTNENKKEINDKQKTVQVKNNNKHKKNNIIGNI